MNTRTPQSGRVSRYPYLDAVKIVAILLVLFIHSGPRGSYLFLSLPGTWLYWPAMANGILCWIAVPLFYMTSGALLLSREESLGKTFLRFFRFLLVLLLFSALPYLHSVWSNHTKPAFVYFLQTVYSSYLFDSYWFLYNYLGILLSLPLLRRLARAMRDMDYLYMLGIYALFKLMYVGELYLWQGETVLNRSLVVFYTSDCVFYPLLGYWLHCRLDERWFTRRNMLLLLASAVTALALNCLVVHWAYAVNDPDPGRYYTCFLYVDAVAVFCGIRQFFRSHVPGERLARVLRLLSECSFGVYLLENMIKPPLLPIYNMLYPYIGQLPACWCWLGACFLLGTAITWILRLIPGLRKLL